MKRIAVLLAIILTLVLTIAVNASNSMTIISDANAGIMVYGPLEYYPGLDSEDWGTPIEAVATWKHGSWPLISGSSAIWISSSYLIEEPVASNTWRKFTKTVELCTGAFNIEGYIHATSDNAEEVYVNGEFIGSDGEVTGPFIDDYEWGTIIDYFFIAEADALTFDFIVRNYAGGSSPTANPTGLIYDIDFTYQCNQPPVADINGPYSGYEGSSIALDGTGSSDPDGDPLSYSWSVDSGLCSFDDPTIPTPNLTCTDNGSFTVSLSVDDGQGTDSADTNVTVANVAPTVAPITVDQNVIPVGTIITTSSAFSDPGTNDTHTADWDWGDSASDTQTPSPGPISASHPYTSPGIYTITLTVTDDDDGVGSVFYEFIVVYDPADGFVTGGGWIDSPEGAYMPGPEGVEIVTSENVGVDWFSPDLRPPGYFAFVPGPDTPPLGSGSLEFGTTSGSDKAQLFNYNHVGTLLSDIESLTYATYRHSTSTNPAVQYPAINMEVDYIGDGNSYTTLVWEPIYSYGDTNLTVDTWQTWDTMAPSQTGFGGGWWSTKNIPGVCAFNCFVSWETILANNPNAKIIFGVGINVGSGWNGIFTGAADALSLTISGTTTTYDFEVVAPYTPTGKATFGFVSKYKKGATVPTGSTEFQFKAADLNFHSSNYEWLVVTGSDYARFKGTGTINGQGDFKFMIWAGDGDPDTFRIKIWEEDLFGVETIIYDNGMDQELGGGSIVVHTR